MYKKFLILIVILFSSSIYSQKTESVNKESLFIKTDSIQKIIKEGISNGLISISEDINKKNKLLESNIKQLNQLIIEVSSKSILLSNKIDSLIKNNNELEFRITDLVEANSSNLKIDIIQLIKKNTDSIENTTKIISNNLLESNSNIVKNYESLNLNSSKIEVVNKDLIKKEETGLFAILFSILLILIVYLFLNRKWNNETKKLSVKQKEILEKQIEDSQKIADWFSESSNESFSSSSNNDHSFAKRVADEIVRISTNLSRMDETIKGHKQLSASVRKLIQTLNVNEYEIAELLNKPYSSGMNLETNFVFDENIPKGSQIITRIIKPQINYKGKIVQSAHVEVSQND